MDHTPLTEQPSSSWQMTTRTRLRGAAQPDKYLFAVAALATGVVSAAYADIFSKIEGLLRACYGSHPYWMLLAGPLLFLASWFMVFRFGKEARGSGIPQVLFSLSRPDLSPVTRHKFLSVRIAAVKIVSSLVSLAGGGAIGREGPTIQIGACIFQHIGHRFPKVFRGEPERSSHAWIVAGAAAGLAAAFNTPLGGLVYAVEELATDGFHKIKATVLTAIIVSGLAALWLSGPYLYLGYPVVGVNASKLVWVLPIAISCGLLGACFGRLLTRVSELRARITRPILFVALSLGCGLLVAAVSLKMPVAGLGSGKELAVKILFGQSLETGIGTALYRFFAPVVTYAAGGAGGIFAPSLSAGAAIGHIVASYLALPASDANLLVLAGMVSFLTGVTRTPFTAFVLVLEMTDQHAAIFPMMISALSAQLVARSIDVKSFYEHVRDMYAATAG